MEKLLGKIKIMEAITYISTKLAKRYKYKDIKTKHTNIVQCIAIKSYQKYNEWIFALFKIKTNFSNFLWLLRSFSIVYGIHHLSIQSQWWFQQEYHNICQYLFHTEHFYLIFMPSLRVVWRLRSNYCVCKVQTWIDYKSALEFEYKRVLL